MKKQKIENKQLVTGKEFDRLSRLFYNLTGQTAETFLFPGLKDRGNEGTGSALVTTTNKEKLIMTYRHNIRQAELEAEGIGDFSVFGDFEKLMSLFGGKLKKPVSDGGGGFIGEAAFSLPVGGVSSVIENLNKTFSIIRVERFLEEEPFSLGRVYSQIERKLKKQKQDSLKKNLGESLFEKYTTKTNREVLSF